MSYKITRQAPTKETEKTKSERKARAIVDIAKSFKFVAEDRSIIAEISATNVEVENNKILFPEWSEADVTIEYVDVLYKDNTTACMCSNKFTIYRFARPTLIVWS